MLFAEKLSVLEALKKMLYGASSSIFTEQVSVGLVYGIIGDGHVYSRVQIYHGDLVVHVAWLEVCSCWFIQVQSVCGHSECFMTAIFGNQGDDGYYRPILFTLILFHIFRLVDRFL